jgi:hypothetical protein
MNDFRLLVAIPSLYNPANYGRFSVCFLSPGVSYPPVFTVVRYKFLRWTNSDLTRQILGFQKGISTVREKSIISHSHKKSRSDCSDCDRSSATYLVPELESGTHCGRASLFIPLHGLGSKSTRTQKMSARRLNSETDY